MNPKEWRTFNNLTLVQLSKQIKVSAGTISLIENGKRNPSGNNVHAYYTHTKGEVTPSDFIWTKRRKG